MVDKVREKVDDVKSIAHNSDVLFIYDARMCNPNGDPDDENKPRMDYSRSRNIVSDVRLKRYIRDYLGDYKNSTIFVSKNEGVTVNAKESLNNILDKKNQDKIDSSEVKLFLDKAIDVRMFGAIVPDVTFKESKANVIFTGPIQFNWGYSLNKVTGPMESNGITSHFHSGKTNEDGESTKSAGAMGKDYRVDYSLIAFHGIISAKRAEYTNLNEKDIGLFDDAMIHAIPLEATTRSKIGQYPLLYIRIEYNSPGFLLGDLRKYVKIADKQGKEMNFDETAKLRSPDEYCLDLTKLCEILGSCKNRIFNIHFWKQDDLSLNGWKENNGILEIKGAKIPIACLDKPDFTN
ncbi:type I-B CRISPR-associated protein Cas7/Csh2 [Methanolobus psychrotolerans]|uniref:type I-B CRISPR-associated protein Cas7/Csh2 n=1 Tax=Methanolobus psychrotolerans TaxID=1874706 RepID=UPI000B9182CF|nr:type I-B CRISPR-associated protein Cas7/Csh2 [Methanolobus psychrotolerans]